MATEKRLISLDEALDATHKEVFWTESEQAAVRSFLVKQPKVDAVILPCKIGDTVFVFWRLAEPDLCSKCPDFCWGGMGDSHRCGKTEDGFRSAECIEIQEWTADLNLILGWIRYNEFNRTVFRTREEAETALAKMDGDGNGT